uniref:Uncharacterized protein n=1 Tax=Panagrolaimus sp. JU765 TaxID=591449 RepID=A0AC34QED2_9BILA
MFQKLVIFVLLALAVSTFAIEAESSNKALRHFLTQISHEKSINLCNIPGTNDCGEGNKCTMYVCMPEQVAVVVEQIWPIIEPIVGQAITSIINNLG